MSYHRTLPIAAAITVSLLLATLASSPRAQPPDGGHAAVDRQVHSLKAAYLRCEQGATERLLGIDDAAGCSTIYERLLKVEFEGDFNRLLAWWHAERIAKARGERIATP